MIDLNRLNVFIRVVEHGSFTAAGNSLNMPKSKVSRMVSELEHNLGARLLERSTRKVSTTEVGQQYYQSCKDKIESLFQNHEEISDKQSNPQGQLKIAIPAQIGSNFMGSFLAHFRYLFPSITVQVVQTDSRVKMIEDQFDVAIQIGHQPDSSMIARNIGESKEVLCATPAYLAKFQNPIFPQDLTQMQAIKLGEGNHWKEYTLTNEFDETEKVKVPAPIITNSLEMLIHSVLSDGGIAAAPLHSVGEYILEGQLKPVFPDWELAQEEVYIIYPSREHLPLRVRKFIDFVVSEKQRFEELIVDVEDLELTIKAFNKVFGYNTYKKSFEN